MPLLPRERYLRDGPTSFGDADLLLLLLGTGAGGRSAAQIAQELIERFGGLEGLGNSEPAAIAGVRGVGVARAIRVHAALQLGRRRAASVSEGAQVITTPEAAARLLVPPLTGLDREELHALFLDNRKRPIARRRITQGSDRATVIDARQVFRMALELRATAVILAHNHPSGDPTASAADDRSTREVTAAGRVLGVEVLDHLIVGNGTWTSMTRFGLAAC